MFMRMMQSSYNIVSEVSVANSRGIGPSRLLFVRSLRVDVSDEIRKISPLILVPRATYKSVSEANFPIDGGMGPVNRFSRRSLHNDGSGIA